MNNPPNEGHTPCQSWTSHDGWSAPTPESLFNTLSGSQHLSMRSSAQRMSYQGLQTPSQSCMAGLASSSSTHHSSLFRNSLSNSPTPGFDGPAMQSSCRAISFDQVKDQPGEARQLPLLSPHDPYKSMRQPVLPAQASPPGLQGVPTALPSCGRRRVNTSQPPPGGVNMEFAFPLGNERRHSSTSQECQWVPPPPCRGETCCLGWESVIFGDRSERICITFTEYGNASLLRDFDLEKL